MELDIHERFEELNEKVDLIMEKLGVNLDDEEEIDEETPEEESDGEVDADDIQE